jgi:hypothetical protein
MIHANACMATTSRQYENPMTLLNVRKSVSSLRNNNITAFTDLQLTDPLMTFVTVAAAASHRIQVMNKLVWQKVKALSVCA